ncbi:DUF4252 domain-containing protein [Neptunitalea lumnitzerae]|uniref:Type IV secretion system putative lipoprotein virB7 n=1 Tax=Neptunitalea lumnitzerae TaxID=2965509 RepID=A0ABQ5MI55_9FLAO|nr:DUF4252 domain-containing protein [Neptunitalea sp. Y10]GLB49088.1 hypothetical protein Y10_14560 [Neptunitalea sp. Y10]
MKKIFILLVSLVALASCGTKTPYDTFREENKEEITFSLNASSTLANLFVNEDDIAGLKNVVSGIKNYRIMVSDNNGGALEKRFKELVNSKKYEELFRVSNNGDDVRLYFYKKGNKIKEIICKVNSKENLVVLSAQGNLKIKDLNKLVEEMTVGSR